MVLPVAVKGSCVYHPGVFVSYQLRWRWLGLLLAFAGLLGSCEGARRGAEGSGRAVQITIEGVTLREYQGNRQRFEFQAGRLVLDEEAEVLRASGEIQGRLEPCLWEERRR